MGTQSAQHAITPAPNDDKPRVVSLSGMAHKLRDVASADTHDSLGFRHCLHLYETFTCRFDKICPKLSLHVSLRNGFHSRDRVSNCKLGSRLAREVRGVSKSVDASVIQVNGTQNVGQVRRRGGTLHIEMG